MIIAFQQHQVVDFERPRTYEDVFRTYASAGGLHDMAFESWYEVPEQVVTGTTAEWALTRVTTTVAPPTCVLDGQYSTIGAGFIVEPVAGQPWVLGIHRDGYACISVYEYEQWQLRARSHAQFTGAHRLRVLVRRTSFAERDTQPFRILALWVDDQLACYTAIPITDTSESVAFGLAAQPDVTCTVTALRIPQLTDVLDIFTLDPGEAPQSGIQRATEGIYLKAKMRFNGTWLVWKPGRVPTIAQRYTDDQLEDELTFALDVRKLVTHVRQVGAYVEADYLRRDLTERYGHRFAVVNNPYLMTEYECFHEAQRLLRQLEQDAWSGQATFPACLYLEPEDAITLNDETFLISGYQLTWLPGEWQATLNVRKYLSPALYDRAVFDEAVYE